MSPVRIRLPPPPVALRRRIEEGPEGAFSFLCLHFGAAFGILHGSHMDILWIVLSAGLVAVSFVGCVIPVLPGPLFAFAGVLALLPSRFAPTAQTCVAFGVAGALVLLLDYVVPAFGAKKFNCSKWGIFGCVVGTMVGIFFVPWGILVGPFAGAVVGELIAGKKLGSSLKGGFGALLGFIFGVALKLAYCATCAGWCIITVVRG